MTSIIPAQFDPRVTLTNTLSGGVNTSDRAILNLRGAQQAQSAQSLQSQFASRIDAALAKFQSSGTSAQIDSLTQQQSLLASRRDRVTQAITVVQKALSQFDYLKSNIDYLRDQLDLLQSGDLTASEVSVNWDNAMRKINLLADAGTLLLKDGKNYFQKNLIDTQSRSSFSTQTLYAPYNQDGQTYQIDGTFLGTDYYITDSGGNFWNSDTGYLGTADQVGTLTQYSSYPDTPTGTSDSVTDITLDSFTRSTGAVTFTLSNATQVTGTVTRGGLGLLDSFLYGNFDTGVDANAITNATSDLNSAESLILTTQAQYQSDLATLQSRTDLFNTQIDGISKDVASQVKNLQSGDAADLASQQLQYLVAKFGYTLLAQRGNSLVNTLILAQDNRLPTTYDTVATGQAITGARVNVLA